MKKNRPGLEIHVLCTLGDVHRFCQTIFDETGTLGIRVYPVERFTLPRRALKIRKKGFEVKLKAVKGLNGQKQIRPEYESMKEIAHHTRTPLRHVHKMIL
jgi:uncharacterized protein (DUF111 family)